MVLGWRWPILLLWCFLTTSIDRVHAQSQGTAGFISIDCGIPAGHSYIDGNISYTSDSDFIDSGDNYNVTSVTIQESTLRSFANGPRRNCYTIKLITNDLKYLVRATFMYGNYDGKNTTSFKPIVFNLHIGVNFWTTISIFNASAVNIAEALISPTRAFIRVCLVDIGSGTPFISSLKVWPLYKTIPKVANLTRVDVSVERNPPQNHCRKWSFCGWRIILCLSIVSVVLVLVLVLLCVWGLGRWKSEPSIGRECDVYTYNELEKITNKFDKELGRGGFGIVYYGTLKTGTQFFKTGTEVAVKKLSEKSEKATRDFLAEVQTLTRVHHTSLVPLIGYWRDGGNLALVYEYMAGGSLQQHLSGEMANARSSNWVERLQIALGAAQGLEYLHVGCKPPIVHRDVKTSNILLDEKLEAKVADFGLAREFSSNTETHKTLTMIGGTPGYVDPEYNSKHQLGPKSDVYSFGVVLFELITGHPALLEDAGAENLVDWVEVKLKSGAVADIVDSRLKEYFPESMTKVVALAKRCTEKTRTIRPSMSDVVTDLKLSLESQKSFQLQANRERSQKLHSAQEG